MQGNFLLVSKIQSGDPFFLQQDGVELLNMEIAKNAEKEVTLKELETLFKN